MVILKNLSKCHSGRSQLIINIVFAGCDSDPFYAVADDSTLN